MTKLRAMALFLMVAMIASCGKDNGIISDRDKVYPVYRLQYEGATGQTRAIVEFFDQTSSGRKLNLSLSVPAVVKFDNTNATFNGTNLSYSRLYSGKKTAVNSLYQFTVNSIVQKNFIQLAKDISLPIDFTTINRSANLDITFNGNALDVNEKAVLRIDTFAFENTTVGSNKFSLTPTDLSKLNAGTAAVTLERRKETEATEAPYAGGKLVGVFRTSPRTITIQ